MSKYAEYLLGQNVATKRVHLSSQPVRQIADNINVQFLPTSSSVPNCLNDLNLNLNLLQVGMFEHIAVEDFCSPDPQKKYTFMKTLQGSGFSMKVAMLIYTHGNSVGNMSFFVWKIPDTNHDEALAQSQRTIETVKESIPIYHTRSMKRALCAKYGRIAPTIKPCILRALYKDLTGDQSAVGDQHEAEVDERVRSLIDMEYPNVIVDLRELNTERKSKFDVFWSVSKVFARRCWHTSGW